MATTNYLNLTLLDVGQKEKEVTINQNMVDLDTKSLRFLGDLTTDPSATNVPYGSTYYNTSSSAPKILRGNGTWQAMGGGSSLPTPTITEFSSAGTINLTNISNFQTFIFKRTANVSGTVTVNFSTFLDNTNPTFFHIGFHDTTNRANDTPLQISTSVTTQLLYPMYGTTFYNIIYTICRFPNNYFAYN